MCVQFLRHPHSLTIYEDWLYWSDRAASRVSRCRKFNCTDRSVVASSISRPLGIAVYSIVKQPPGGVLFPARVFVLSLMSWQEFNLLSCLMCLE